MKKIASLKSAQLSFEKVTTQSQKMKKSVLGSRDGFASGSVARRDQADKKSIDLSSLQIQTKNPFRNNSVTKEKYPGMWYVFWKKVFSQLVLIVSV